MPPPWGDNSEQTIVIYYRFVLVLFFSAGAFSRFAPFFVAVAPLRPCGRIFYVGTGAPAPKYGHIIFVGKGARAPRNSIVFVFIQSVKGKPSAQAPLTD